MHNRQGIVLKSYLPYKCKIAVLDEQWGRIDCVPDTQRVCVGALIGYKTVSQESHCIIRDLEQIAVPFALARVDLLFFHHVLEICYLGIAHASREPDIFALLLVLYGNVPSSLMYKKAFLAKLFFLLGMHGAPSRSVRNHQLFALCTQSVDTMANRFIDLGMEKEVDEWLRWCVQEHPYRAQFKTVDFYTRMASDECT